MTMSEFALQTDARKIGTLSLALQAMWHDGQGNWTQAHTVAQQGEGRSDCDWVHAYLHRKEGDAFNAGYWYRRARKPVFVGQLADEWQALVSALLSM